MSDDVATINPSRSALLVMDYQVGTLSGIDDADGLVSRVGELLTTARAKGVQVAYVRMAFEDADFYAVPSHTKLSSILAASGRALHVDSPVTAIDDRVAPQPGDIVVRKVRVGAFSSTDLDQQLRRRGIDTVIVAGITTSAVVLSTVIDAFDRDYLVYVLADVTADHSRDVHEFLLKNVFPRLSTVMSSAQLADELSSGE